MYRIALLSVYLRQQHLMQTLTTLKSVLSNILQASTSRGIHYFQMRTATKYATSTRITNLNQMLRQYNTTKFVHIRFRTKLSTQTLYRKLPAANLTILRNLNHKTSTLTHIPDILYAHHTSLSVRQMHRLKLVFDRVLRQFVSRYINSNCALFIAYLTKNIRQFTRHATHCQLLILNSLATKFIPQFFRTNPNLLNLTHPVLFFFCKCRRKLLHQQKHHRTLSCYRRFLCCSLISS